MRVLMFAYACDPYRGSESAAGWGLSRAVASFADAVVLHGPDHRDNMRRWSAHHPEDPVQYVTVDEPSWCGVANRSRIGRFLSYVAWMRRAGRVAVNLHRERPFDAVHHATYATYWLPSPVRALEAPSVWGPVGGAVSTPLRLWSALGWRGLPTEILDLVAVRVASWLPATRRTWRAADVRLLLNPETRRRLSSPSRETTEILNHVLFLEHETLPRAPRRGELLYLSPLEFRKGPRLALLALARAPGNLRLRIVGDGPERARLEALSRRLGLAEQVTFEGWVELDALPRLYAQAEAVVFTGLREEGGASLAEAMGCGAPVVVLAHGGAATVASCTTDPSRVRLVEPGSLNQTIDRLAGAMSGWPDDAVFAQGGHLDRASALRRLESAFEAAIGRAGAQGRRDGARGGLRDRSASSRSTRVARRPAGASGDETEN
ncbi:MAG: glycosyltransferase [Candidatus Palauibacterales bacterium]|nr:glycosyltransferase [Candidatus Palauibacterales bacterium]